MSWVSRIGLAIVHPRWALAIAGDRKHAGRSGSDLLAAIGVLLLATQLRGLASAVLLGPAAGWSLAARALVSLLTHALTIDLGFLVIGAVVVFALAGPRRELGRAFDLACVAALPLVFVDLAASVLVRVLDLDVPAPAMWALSGIAYAWTGTLLGLALPEARRSGQHGAEPPAPTIKAARGAGFVVAVVAILGTIVPADAIAQHPDLVRPMASGAPAPAFSLPQIGKQGALGPRIGIPAGKVTVIDFWATWCNPCLKALPRLDAFAKAHPDVAVIAVNIDDPAEARALFDQKGYTITLVADDELTSQRFGVSTIPHTVVIDRSGIVRRVERGGGLDLEAELAKLR